MPRPAAENVYPLDRLEVPKFFTPKSNETFPNAFGYVLAPTGKHDTSKWVSLGYVSKQTPFGQGTYMGFPRKDVRKASREEVLAALEKDHPFSRFFRPACPEVLNYNGYQLFLIITSNEVCHQEDRDRLRKIMKKHREMMVYWDKVCRDQIDLIKLSLDKSFNI